MSIEMNGKICIITGANSGVGKVSALEMSKMGATIVMVCRNPKKGEDALAEIKQKSGNDSVDLMICDVSSLASVRKFAAEFKEKYNKLHVLMNNAGGVIPERRVSVDGYELSFATNHLGRFLLTNLLLDMIKDSAPARIVNVASEAHVLTKIDFDDLHYEKREYVTFLAYGQAKLADVLCTYALARRLEGTGVTVNCLHPGEVRTNFGSDSQFVQDGLVALGDAVLTPEEGAITQIYLATSPEVEKLTGKYFKSSIKPRRSSRVSYNEDLQQKVWELSEKLTGLV